MVEHRPTLSFFRGLPLGLWLGLFVSALYVLAVLLGTGPVVTASIEGSTEALELQTKTPAVQWTLPGFRMLACGGTAATPMEGMTLLIHEGARIRIDRPESGPTSVIDISALDGTAANADCSATLPVDLIDQSGSSHKLLGAHVRFIRDDAMARSSTTPAVVLPIHARVFVGEEVGDGVNRMLLKGSVTIHADQSHAATTKLLGFLHRKRTYIGESVTLARGDRIQPPDVGGEEAAADKEAPRSDPAPHRAVSDDLANGYLRLAPNDAIQFAFIEAADRVVIQRAGNAKVEVDLSFWQRLENEPALTGVIAFLVALLALVDLSSRFLESERFGASGRSARENTPG